MLSLLNKFLIMCNVILQELELSIQQEMAQHQRELSGLQTVQNERVSSLSQRHQDEVDQLQRRINELERASFEGGHSATNSATQAHTDGKEAAVMKRRCAQLEAEVEKLTRKMDEMEKESPSGTDKVKEEQIEQLSSENLRLSQINGQLENELKREQVKKFSLTYTCTYSHTLFSPPLLPPPILPQ